MKRKSIAIVVVSLFAVLLSSACASPRLVRDLSAVYAANAETIGLPELADHQALAEYMATLSPGFVPAESAETTMQNNFLADLQARAEYQGTPPYLIFVESPAPIRQPAPLMLNDRQDLAEYQLLLSNGYVE